MWLRVLARCHGRTFPIGCLGSASPSFCEPMDSRVSLSLTTDGDGPTDGDVICRVEVDDPALAGLDAIFSLRAAVDVHDSRAVNASTELFERHLRLSSIAEEIRVPRSTIRAYSYSGSMIDSKLVMKLVIDDAILFDTKITEEQELAIGVKPEVSTHAQTLIEPEDVFDFFKNLQAIPVSARGWTIALGVVGAVVIVVNMLVGLHDQFVGEGATWFYSRYNSDGESNSPFVAALVGSGGVGLAVWLAIRRQLRRYMSFHFRAQMPVIRPGVSYSLAELVAGRPRVDLNDVTVRVVACNLELGQYRRGSGTDERTVSFREPIRGVLLHEQHLERVPAGSALGDVLGSVDFTQMFTDLYPPFEVGSSHGIAVHWEIQLLHPEYVDQELKGDVDSLEYADFLPS